LSGPRRMIATTAITRSLAGSRFSICCQLYGAVTVTG
jgi:hypothetical protein